MTVGGKSPPLVVKGWSIYAHPVFLDQLDALIEEVEARKARDPDGWRKKNCTKRLAAILQLVRDRIPSDPGAPDFRQGNTLGSNRKHWFRAKFFQQYRLFYRFNSEAKIIVLAWVNDEKTRRAYSSRTDAYLTFKAMLENGNPPDSFDTLLREAENVTERAKTSLAGAQE